MLLGITNMPGGCGFGNRFLYYYNLRQEAHKRGWSYFSVPWNGHNLFEGNMLGSYMPGAPYQNFPFCLGEKLYDYDGISTREVFKLKNPPQVQNGVCAIHFRGTDFHQWNPDSILDSKYYLESIEEVKDSASGFILFTDDQQLPSYQKVLAFIKDEKLSYLTGDNMADRNYYMKDFSIMSECDYIISSPSTFGIAAGLIGKHKKIIHSKKWVLDRVSREDKFWVDLHAGGNEDYSLWRLV
tara:strand:+ start:579 stop:1298 length:720 start_codon:yes stop_codon:yes gene_type:complete